MRTKTLLLTAALLAAGLAPSMAAVYSQNVVGYVNVTLTGGNKYTAVANPVNAATNTFAALLGTLPTGSTVLKWNAGISDYDTYNKTGFGVGWSPASGATTLLSPGEGAMVLIAGSDFTNSFVGEVLQGDMTNSFSTGYKLVANMVPDSGLASSLQLTNVPTGSTLLKWDVNIQDFVPYNKTGFGIGWSPSVPNINVGEAFFIQANGSFNWVRNFTVQ